MSEKRRSREAVIVVEKRARRGAESHRVIMLLCGIVIFTNGRLLLHIIRNLNVAAKL